METKADWQNLLVKKEDRITVITINRPQTLNALNMELMKELEACFTAVADDEETDVIILTGAGKKSFIAGADIKEMAVMNGDSGRKWALAGEKVANLIEMAPQPVIGAINGYALGGGCEMALACDFRYASENAAFGQLEVKWGLSPCFGGTQRLPRAIGPGMARELLYSARVIDAAEALRIGLVNQVFPSSELLGAALRTAAEIRENSMTAVRFTKQSVNTGRDMDIRNAIYHEAQFSAICFADPERRKRMDTFMKK